MHLQQLKLIRNSEVVDCGYYMWQKVIQELENSVAP